MRRGLATASPARLLCLTAIDGGSKLPKLLRRKSMKSSKTKLLQWAHGAAALFVINEAYNI